jgi:hypothetical protein
MGFDFTPILGRAGLEERRNIRREIRPLEVQHCIFGHRFVNGQEQPVKVPHVSDF